MQEALQDTEDQEAGLRDNRGGSQEVHHRGHRVVHRITIEDGQEVHHQDNIEDPEVFLQDVKEENPEVHRHEGGQEAGLQSSKEEGLVVSLQNETHSIGPNLRRNWMKMRWQEKELR